MNGTLKLSKPQNDDAGETRWSTAVWFDLLHFPVRTFVLEDRNRSPSASRWPAGQLTALPHQWLHLRNKCRNPSSVQQKEAALFTGTGWGSSGPLNPILTLKSAEPHLWYLLRLKSSGRICRQRCIRHHVNTGLCHYCLTGIKRRPDTSLTLANIPLNC